MLEKPDLPDEQIIACIQSEYGLSIDRLTFLPLGADVDTAVYQVDAGQANYFLKLRRGLFDETTLAVPQYLASLGIQAIIAPIQPDSGKSWVVLDEYKLVLYPFIPGIDAYQKALSERQWIVFGQTLKAIHAAPIPPTLRVLLPVEQYSPLWRDMVKEFQAQVERMEYTDPVADQMASVMRSHRVEIDHLVRRAGLLAADLQARNLEFVLCHSDIHAGNIHLGPEDALYIVDWDNPILAPKERDLMMIGGSPVWKEPQMVALFYQGYGPAEVDRTALAYYRYERIIWDIAAYCEQLLASTAGGEDREQSLRYFASNFLPGHELDLARQMDSE